LSQTRRQRIGKWGEGVAADYLEQKGYVILARNVYTSYGEIDLITRQTNGELIFIEVKTRTSDSFGEPEEAVDSRKLSHLVSSVQAYITNIPGQVEEHWRIDVISVQGKPGLDPADVRIEHFENVVS